jgi:hypothetical protein
VPRETQPQTEAPRKKPAREDRPREARPEEPRRERQPELVGTASEPKKQAPQRKRDSGSPFGDDGPIPAFLLRPSRAG